MAEKKCLSEQRFTGERALFNSHGLCIRDSIFADGESPLKESSDIEVDNSAFQWKYPFWYCNNVMVKNSSFFDMARAGIWYTKNISLMDCIYHAPKGFRRAENVCLSNVDFTNAAETLWNCRKIRMDNVSARGDYFAMNSCDMELKDFRLVGNYSFDGCSNVVVTGSKLLCKDAFWNCDNVFVKDSYISGEYVGWNSSNITFENCTIESLQGFCYMDNVRLINCKLLNTDLSFEYSTVDADITTGIRSVKNPSGGKIVCKGIDELIFDDPEISSDATEIKFTDCGA